MCDVRDLKRPICAEVLLRYWRSIVLCVVGCVGAVTAAGAGPVYLEETKRIVSPESNAEIRYVTNWDFSHFSSRVAVSGDTMLVLGVEELAVDFIKYVPWVFARNANGDWQYQATLATDDRTEIFWGTPMDVDIRDDLAIARDIFARTATGWTNVADLYLGPESKIDGDRVLDSSDAPPGWSAQLYEENSGQWSLTHTITIPDILKENDGEFHGGQVDLSGDQLIIHAPTGMNADETMGFRDRAAIFERTPSGWNQVAALHAPGEDVAIESGVAFVGSHRFVRMSTGDWNAAGVYRSDDFPARGDARTIELENGLLVAGHPGDDIRGSGSGSISVWQREADEYVEVARLVASDGMGGGGLGYDLDVDGRRVVAVSNGAAYVFDLPESFVQRELMHEDFENGDVSSWSALPGSTFTLATVNGSRVYRQSNLNGDAGSIYQPADWENISIQADLRATQYGTKGPVRWFGLFTRRTDSSNYYYVTVRNTNVVELKKMVNGSFSAIASAPLPVALNKTYRVRLEAVGTRLRVFNDDKLLIEATDDTHQRGKAGVQVYLTAVDVDNVIVSPAPQVNLFQDNFESPFSDPVRWTHSGEGVWTKAGDANRVFVQTNVNTPVGARAIASPLVPSGAQSIRVRVRPTSFGTTSTPWFGLIARYIDDLNYYYVTIRKNNVASLRKLVNGSIHELDSIPLSVTAGQWYDLRMEAIDDSVRVYVNGTLRLEAKDTTFPRGGYGLMTFRTTAQFDDVVVTQP